MDEPRISSGDALASLVDGPAFPRYRPRRWRRSEPLRSLVRETNLVPSNFVLPLFVVPGEGVRRPVPALPGVAQTSPDEAVRDAREAWDLGVPAVLLFGVPERKDPHGRSGLDRQGVVPQAIRRLKDALPDLAVLADVCLCEYTDHGHCGVIVGEQVDNDATLPLLAEMAVAGADVVAPSDMMDGRVAAIRAALDDAGYSHVAILSYAVKYASAFYGPFRHAAENAPAFGDRRGYQMDPANAREAVREAFLDVREGADGLIVKPAGLCLDVIARVKEATGWPVVGYQVSGEYAMIHAAAERGWLDGDRALWEAALAIRRAGADAIITYAARTLARACGTQRFEQGKQVDARDDAPLAVGGRTGNRRPRRRAAGDSAGHHRASAGRRHPA